MTHWGSFKVLKSRANAITKKTNFLHFKVGQVVLESRTSITKWDRQVLQIRAIIIN